MKPETKVIDTVTDPVCGMTIEPAVAAQSRVHNGGCLVGSGKVL